MVYNKLPLQIPMWQKSGINDFFGGKDGVVFYFL